MRRSRSSPGHPDQHIAPLAEQDRPSFQPGQRLTRCLASPRDRPVVAPRSSAAASVPGAVLSSSSIAPLPRRDLGPGSAPVPLGAGQRRGPPAPRRKAGAGRDVVRVTHQPVHGSWATGAVGKVYPGQICRVGRYAAARRTRSHRRLRLARPRRPSLGGTFAGVVGGVTVGYRPLGSNWRSAGERRAAVNVTGRAHRSVDRRPPHHRRRIRVAGMAPRSADIRRQRRHGRSTSTQRCLLLRRGPGG